MSENEWKSRYQSWIYDSSVWMLINSTRGLCRYLDLMERSLLSIKEYALEPLTDDEAEGISDYHRKVIDKSYSDNMFDKHDFPKEFYKSFVMALFARVEKELLELCGGQYLDLKLTISPDDRDGIGTGIFRAYKFLVQGLGYSLNDPLWRELQVIGKVRNRIVHNDWPYIAPVLKPKNTSVVKIHVEIRDHSQDYYLQMDPEFYKHITEHRILEITAIMTTDIPIEEQFAGFEIRPDYAYCDYLINFRKKFFLRIYNDLLGIANKS